MGFKINTNVAAMNAHMNSLNNNRALDKSLAALSTGLRINKAADDASGMAIANQLKSQANGLGQAIRNANDGINVAQTADGALEEYTNIINTVRTKAIQAASDGQNADSRKAIQADIDKLLEEAQNIAKTTSFNGQNLLDGSFKDKKFHIGAYAGETVGIDIKSAKTSDIGKLTSVTNDGTVNSGTANDGIGTRDALATSNLVESGSGYALKANEMTINGTDISESLNKNSPNDFQSAKAIAAAITDATGILAQGHTKLVGAAAVGGGSIPANTGLKINGVAIAATTVVAGDSDGALVRAINDISDQTGVTASTSGGKLVLEANDGRNISITTSDDGSITGLTADNLTNQTGSGAVNDINSSATSKTIAEGELVINGVDLAGTYGDGTAGSVTSQLQNAIRNIAGMEDSSIASDGTISLVVNNGNDLNIAGSAANSTYNLTKGVFNESQTGVVEIFSEEKVTIGGTDPGSFGFTAGGFTPKSNDISLDSIDVTTRQGAEVAIKIADAALKEIDSVRSNIGSTQNQLESTVRNISVTQVNVTAAESTIRDVDFAAESANLQKRNILAQSGVYAMSQANAVQQNVMRLLQ